jgi:hypothetical protein
MRRNLNEHLFAATNLGSNVIDPSSTWYLEIAVFERLQRPPLFAAHSADKPLRRLADYVRDFRERFEIKGSQTVQHALMARSMIHLQPSEP